MKKFLLTILLLILIEVNMNCEILIDTDDKVVRCEDDTKICYVFQINGQNIVKCSKKLPQKTSK